MKITAEDFNKKYPVGTKVRFYPIKGEAGYVDTVTRTPAWKLGNGKVVVSCKGHTGGLSIEHIEILQEVPEGDKMPDGPRIASHVLPSIPEIIANKDHVVMVLDVSQIPPDTNLMTIGLRFDSPEHLLTVMTAIMEKVVEVWPNHPLVKEYLEP